MNNPKFQVYLGKDKQFYFRLYASNGEIILTGEGYASKAGCQHAIQSVKENASKDERYQRKTAADGQFHFTLTSTNGEVIGISEMYKTSQGREHGIEAVQQTAPAAPIEDMA